MAQQDPSNSNQQSDDNTPLSADLTRVKSIKTIGLYTATDREEIDNLFKQLFKIFNREDLLFNNQKISVRINGATQATELTTEIKFPREVEPSQKRKLLFLSDYVSLIIGLAKTIQAIWPSEELVIYGDALTESQVLSDWGHSGRENYISELELIKHRDKIVDLLKTTADVFYQHSGVEEDQAEDSENDAIAETITPTESTPARGRKRLRTREPETKFDSQDQEITTEDQVSTNATIANQANFVYAAAYSNLVSQFLEEANLSQFDLPSEMQRQLAQIEQLLRERIWDIIDRLPPERLQQLSDRSGSIAIRLYIYQRLLIEVFNDPQLSVLLKQFYQEYVQLVVRENPQQAEASVDKLQQHFESIAAVEGIDTSELNEALEEIRQEIRAWKQRFLQQLQTEAHIQEEAKTQQTQPVPEELLTASQELESKAINRLAAPKIAFEPNQTTQLSTHLANQSITEADQKYIQDQSARLLWGTLAELFEDDPEQLAKLPPEIRNQVFNSTITYLLSLSNEELLKLKKSPSSLIRHIKNNAGRILTDNTFQKLYQKYDDDKYALVFSRVDRIDRETNWAYEQVVFQLFSANDITDPSVPDGNGLQDVFDDIKGYLLEDIFAYFSQLPEEDLLNLYMKAKDRKQLIKEIYQYLNADPVFVQTLSQFYRQMLIHYEQTNQTSQKNILQQRLNSLIQIDGDFVELKATQPAPRDFFNNSLEGLLETDSKLVTEVAHSTIQSLLIADGLDSTLDFINLNNPELLGLAFNLPKGMLNENNVAEFRTLLSNYAQYSFANLQAVSGLTSNGLNLSAGSATKQQGSQTTDATTQQLEKVRTVQTVIQSRGTDGEETVAASLSTKSVKEKKDIVLKIFGGEWNNLSQQSQIAIYLYYELPFIEEKYANDIEKKLPFPFEFIDFKAKKNYLDLLNDITTEYSNNGSKNFNELYTAEHLEKAAPGADAFRNESSTAIIAQVNNLAQLSKQQQRVLAEAAGYRKVEKFLEVHYVSAQLVLEKDPEKYAQFLEKVPVIAEINPDYGKELEGPTSSALANRLLPQQPNSSQRLTNALDEMASGKISRDALKKGATSLAARTGLGAIASGGLLTAGVLIAAALENKDFRNAVLIGTTYVVTSYLYALSTIGGLLGAIIGGIGGLALGPLGMVGGSIAGTYIGSTVLPQQWGGWFGFSPRQAPGMGSYFSSEQPVSAAQSDMAALRAAAGKDTSLAAASQAAGPINVGLSGTPTLNAGLGASGTSAAGIGATGAGAGTAAGSSGGLFTSFFGMSIGIAAPLLAVGSMLILTLTTIVVIMGAFVAPVPTRNDDWKNSDEDISQQEFASQFVEITKKASITQIENNTPTEVTYTVTVRPKGSYSLLITDVTDRFTNFGDDIALQSPMSAASFPGEPFSEEVTVEYTVPNIGENMVDTLVTNNFIATFDVYDTNGYPVNRDETYRASASVRVGEPKEGCWPTTGTKGQGPGGSFSHGGTDAYDIVAPTGTKVYAPFSGKLCRQIDDMQTHEDDPAYGIWVTLEVNRGSDTYRLIFSHLRSAIIDTPGPSGCRQVSAQEYIADVDDTGYSTDPHLHYELKPSPVNGIRLDDLLPKEANGELAPRGVTVYDCAS